MICLTNSLDHMSEHTLEGIVDLLKQNGQSLRSDQIAGRLNMNVNEILRILLSHPSQQFIEIEVNKEADRIKQPTYKLRS